MGLVFFLGAGASVAAKVPATFEMVDRVLSSLPAGSQARSATEEIVGRLRKWSSESSGRPVADIELLLDVLDRLLAPQEDPLVSFYDHAEYALSGHAPDAALRSKLRNIIKRSCIVDEPNIRYLDPFRQFLRFGRPVDVFTVNYDTTIEQLCNAYKLRCEDGFDLEWNPGAFDRSCDIRLHKLHGSITWYLSDRGTYLKIPVLTDEESIELITREQARTLMVYPARKWQTSEPLLDLLVRLRKALEVADLVVVVGYSFRDDHIRDIFLDAARKNPSLRVILISPSSVRIAETRLVSYPEGLPSSLADRVVCLPYRFEVVFPVLYDQFISPLRQALSGEGEGVSRELSGSKSDWASPLLHFARAEDIESAERIAERTGPPEDLQIASEVCMRLWVGNWLRGRSELARRYLRGFLRSLAPYEPSHLEFQLDRNPSGLSMWFRHSATGSYGGSNLRGFLLGLGEVLQFRIKAVARQWEGGLQEARTRVDSLREYLAPWNEGRIEAKEYIRLRGGAVPPLELAELANRFEYLKQAEKPGLSDMILDRVRQFERPFYEKGWASLSSLADLPYVAPPR